MKLGLTGGIASGKSTVSSYFKSLSYPVVDADLVSKELLESGNEGLQAIVDVFGPSFLHPDGSYNRKKMGDLVFKDQDALKLLNETLHPIILKEISRQIGDLEAEGYPLLVCDIPLLFETGFDQEMDQTMLVYVDLETQIDRLMKRDQIDRSNALDKINSQLSLEEKLTLADVIIDNSGSREETFKQIDQWIAEEELYW